MNPSLLLTPPTHAIGTSAARIFRIITITTTTTREHSQGPLDVSALRHGLHGYSGSPCFS